MARLLAALLLVSSGCAHYWVQERVLARMNATDEDLEHIAIAARRVENERLVTIDEQH